MLTHGATSDATCQGSEQFDWMDGFLHVLCLRYDSEEVVLVEPQEWRQAFEAFTE